MTRSFIFESIVFLFLPSALFAQSISWEKTGAILGEDQTCVVAMATNGEGHIFANLSFNQGAGVWRSTNNGGSWTRIYAGDLFFGLAVNSSGHIFIASITEGVFRSTNNGDIFIRADSGLNSAPVNILAINSAGHLYAGMSFGAGNIFRSTDNGTSWTQMHPGLPSTAVDVIAFNSSGHIFAGTRRHTIFRSIDDGQTWDEVLVGVSSPTFMILAGMAVNTSGDIFVGTTDASGGGDGIFRSTDYGQTWTSVNNGLATLSVSSIIINSDGHIFAATDNGVFRSTDNAETWGDVSSGLLVAGGRSLAFDPQGRLLLGTCAGGIYRTDQSTTPVEDEAQIPSAFALQQNYPNPFNPTTIIGYQVPKAVHVSLKVYSITGQEIATLANETRGPGYYQIQWSPERLASGVYIYRMQAGEFVETKKLVLLR